MRCGQPFSTPEQTPPSAKVSAVAHDQRLYEVTTMTAAEATVGRSSYLWNVDLGQGPNPLG